MSSISSRKKMFAGIAVAALASLPLAACSSSGSDEAGAEETQSQVAKPVARINALSGDSTAIALDTGFTDALTTPGSRTAR